MTLQGLIALFRRAPSWKHLGQTTVFEIEPDAWDDLKAARGSGRHIRLLFPCGRVAGHQHATPGLAKACRGLVKEPQQ